MPILPAFAEILSAAAKPLPQKRITARDANLPAIPGKAHAIIGMRRAGKTTFLKQLQAEQRALQARAPEQSIYVSFDDDRLAGIGTEQLNEMLEWHATQFAHKPSTVRTTWYLDEIQLVPGWERFVRRVLDADNANIVVSGSSAKMLSREVHTSLRGRGVESIISPFSFIEYLRHHAVDLGKHARKPQRMTSTEHALAQHHFARYLQVGGFPEVQGLDTGLRIQLLQSYVDTVMFRDVVERHEVSQVAALRWLVRHCLRNPASSLSLSKLYNDFKAQGLSVARDAVYVLFGHLVDAFLLSAVPIATDSERRRNSNPRKIYPVDHGMVIAFDRSGRPNIGHNLEVLVANELARRKAELSYVRTANGFEVDFFARFPTGEQQLVQVCADISDASTLARELRAFDDALTEHPQATCLLLVMGKTDAQALSRQDLPAHVQVQAVYAWLLESGAA